MADTAHKTIAAIDKPNKIMFKSEPNSIKSHPKAEGKIKHIEVDTIEVSNFHGTYCAESTFIDFVTTNRGEFRGQQSQTMERVINKTFIN